MFPVNTTKADKRQQEKKKNQDELGVCRIRREDENQRPKTLGSGFVVKDLPIVEAIDCQYCLISTKEVFPNNCDIKSYYLDFKKLNKQNLETIKLGHIASSTKINRDLFSGLVVIPIQPSDKCSSKESIFTYRPFKVVDEGRTPNQDLRCCFVDDPKDQKQIFSVKRLTLKQSETNPLQYQLLEPPDLPYTTYNEVTCKGDAKPYGGAILTYVDNEHVVVGAMTFTDDDRRGISPVFFRHSPVLHHNQERNAAVAGWTVSAAAATQKESLQTGETNAESLTIISPIQDGVENTVDAGATETAQQPTPATISDDQRLIGSSNGEIPPEEVPFSYSLHSPVQDILDERPELLKGFMEEMDKENVWGNGWRRFYKKLGLPDGREAAMERGGGSPTLNVIKGWISREGRNATVQALISAVNRSERKDCSYFLEKSLRCQLDYVDSPMENVTKEMSSLSTGPREVKFFGDLNDTQATEIVDKLGQDAKKLLRRELESGPNDSNLSTKDLILRRKSYPIRKYTDLLADGCRGQAIKTLREALPTSKGVVGPLLPINKFIRDVGHTVRSNLTRNLSADDHWKFLAERLEVKQTDVNFYNSRSEDPAEKVLRHWEVKAHSTVGELYDILVEIKCPLIADLL